VVVDETTRAIPGLALGTWRAVAGTRLGGGEGISMGRLRELAERARRTGSGYFALADFLCDCLSRAEHARRHVNDSRRPKLARVALAVAGMFALALLAAVVWTGVQQKKAVAIAATTLEADVTLARSDPDALGQAFARLDAEAAGTKPRGRALSYLRRRSPRTIAAARVLEAAIARESGRHLAEMLDTAFARDGCARRTCTLPSPNG
jgi:hypothetical protein